MNKQLLFLLLVVIILGALVKISFFDDTQRPLVLKQDSNIVIEDVQSDGAAISCMHDTDCESLVPYLIDGACTYQARCNSIGSCVIECKTKAHEHIEVFFPKEKQVVTSPLIVQGRVRGTWMFENSFPVSLLANNGEEIAISFGSSSENWMTEEFIPFEAKLEFAAQNSDSGILRLKKDNPSGLPELDDSIDIMVRFH